MAVLIFDMLPVFLFKFKTGFLYGSLLLPLKKIPNNFS